MAFSLRMGTPEDYDALVQFWCDNSGWDIITREQWEHRFIHTPGGPAAFSLVIDDETQEIVGQFLFVPSPVSVDGNMVKGYRPFAPVIKESIRNQGTTALQELMIQMYFNAFATLSNEGASLIYMLPDPRWIRILQKQPFFQISTFPLYSKPLPLEQPVALPAGYSIEHLHYDDHRIDVLWEKARQNYGCIGRRDSKSLAWKLSHGHYKLVGVNNESGLAGLFATVQKDRDHQLLICDVLVDGEQSLDATFSAVLIEASNQLASLSEDQPAFTKVAMLAPSFMQPALEKLEFVKEKYAFYSLIHLFDPALEPEQVAPDRWYFSAND